MKTSSDLRLRQRGEELGTLLVRNAVLSLVEKNCHHVYVYIPFHFTQARRQLNWNGGHA